MPRYQHVRESGLRIDVRPAGWRRLLRFVPYWAGSRFSLRLRFEVDSRWDYRVEMSGKELGRGEVEVEHVETVSLPDGANLAAGDHRCQIAVAYLQNRSRHRGRAYEIAEFRAFDADVLMMNAAAAIVGGAVVALLTLWLSGTFQ